MNYIKSINWITTYQCNLQCTHCDIWENPEKDIIGLQEIDTLFGSRIFKESYAYYKDSFDIAISGGEPLLIKDLETRMDIIEERLPGSIHSLSTNGTLEERLIKLLIYWKKKGRNFRKINISIDGSEVSHDTQRGRKGSFKTSIHTIQKVKKVFPEQVIEIKLTITKENFRDIGILSKLASELGVFFSFKPVENMTNYTNQKRVNEKKFFSSEIDIIEAQIIKNPYIHSQDYYITKKFFQNIPDYLRNGLGEKKKLCSVAEDSITIMPDGKIFGCILMDSIGTLKEANINDLWNGESLENQRKKIKNGECPECMLMCGAFKSKSIYA